MDKRLVYLLQQVSRGVASEEEFGELLELIRTDRSGEAVTIIDEFLRVSPGDSAPYSPEEMDTLFAAILKAGREPFKASDIPETPVRPMRFWSRRWAAAAIILCLCSGAYLLFRLNQKPPQEAAVMMPPNDALPGRNGAVLTLADGRKVVLDSVAGGVIATQGNMEVKLRNGAVRYDKVVGTAVGNTMAYNTLTTPRGRQYQIILPDGSKVWLNAASSITYPIAFSGNERMVTITGEAYFEVTKNKAMPFRVKVNDMEVEVLGTLFDINSYGDEGNIQTTLLEGSVRVANTGSQPVLLQPGQQAQSAAGIQAQPAAGIKVVSHPDIEQVMAWKNGLFNFEGADLKTVLRQLGRWYDVDVIFEGNVPDRKFGGEMSRDLNLSQVLHSLEKLEIKFRIEGKKLIVHK